MQTGTSTLGWLIRLPQGAREAMNRFVRLPLADDNSHAPLPLTYFQQNKTACKHPQTFTYLEVQVVFVLIESAPRSSAKSTPPFLQTFRVWIS